MHGKMLSSIPGLHTLAASSTFSVVPNKSVFRPFQMPFGGQHCLPLLLRTTVLEKQSRVMVKSKGVGAFILSLISMPQFSHLYNEDSND